MPRMAIIGSAATQTSSTGRLKRYDARTTRTRCGAENLVISGLSLYRPSIDSSPVVNHGT